MHLQQVYQGIPVLGGELIVQLDADKNVISTNAEILPDLELNVTPNLDAAAARGILPGALCWQRRACHLRDQSIGLSTRGGTRLAR